MLNVNINNTLFNKYKYGNVQFELAFYELLSNMLISFIDKKRKIVYIIILYRPTYLWDNLSVNF